MTESFIESCSVLNSLMFQEVGRTQLAETYAQWGVRGGETGLELRQLVEEYKSFMAS